MTPRTLQILLALVDGPLHGYGIKASVEERTGGSVRIGAGTLYEAIQRLEADGWIREVNEPRDADASGGPPRRFYSMTPAGRTALREELQRLDDIVRSRSARTVLNG